MTASEPTAGAAGDGTTGDGGLDDHALAATIATEAGKMLVALREEMFASGQPFWDVGERGDAAAHDLIFSRLRAARPTDGLLSEEERVSPYERERPDPIRLGRERVWIVDPLDGTKEFRERGRSDWAVHIALCVNGAPVAGAVALPAMGMTFATQPAPSLPAPRGGRVRQVTSRSLMPPSAYVVANALGADVLPMGSAGAKAMAVVAGGADIYVHSGGMYEWDSCAPVAVAQAAGLHASRIDGSPLVYNSTDAWLPDLLICRRELAADALATLREGMASGYYY